jgi:hypothetical protein
MTETVHVRREDAPWLTRCGAKETSDDLTSSAFARLMTADKGSTIEALICPTCRRLFWNAVRRAT